MHDRDLRDSAANCACLHAREAAPAITRKGRALLAKAQAKWAAAQGALDALSALRAAA
jgi:hypothetical protein